jgi:DNA-directed RNA polymerase specialized sigma24 family protein
MSDVSSITLWLHRLKAGDRSQAVDRLWNVYFTKMVGLARRHLGSRNRAADDEEDVALSAFQSFVEAAQRGRFPRLDDRDDLWQVLFVVTARKTADHVESAGRQKRGGGRVIQPLIDEIDLLASSEPDPAEAIALTEDLEALLTRLDDPLLKQIALQKLDGYTNEEIAVRIERSVPTVERKLALIREKWSA